MNTSLSLSTCSAPDWSPRSDALLRGVYAATGLDLSGYRRSSLARRIEARMAQVGLENADDYAAYCEGEADEYGRLAQTILIHVTGFFRDPAVWTAVETEVVPRLLEQTRAPLCLWCAGCASGEEAYTLGMILAEILGRDGLADRVRLLATDVSGSVLERARLGVYSDAAVAAMPPGLRDAYWTRTPKGWTACPELRDAVRFERHDLTHAPPLYRFDLISCRNTLMYFDLPLQHRALAGLAGVLRADGCLLLGQAEGILPGDPFFAPMSTAHEMSTAPHPLFTRRPRKAAPTAERLRKSVCLSKD